MQIKAKILENSLSPRLFSDFCCYSQLDLIISLQPRGHACCFSKWPVILQIREFLMAVSSDQREQLTGSLLHLIDAYMQKSPFIEANLNHCYIVFQYINSPHQQMLMMPAIISFFSHAICHLYIYLFSYLVIVLIIPYLSLQNANSWGDGIIFLFSSFIFPKHRDRDSGYGSYQ